MKYYRIHKFLHNFNYWTNPFYMISYDICMNPELVKKYIGPILKFFKLKK